MKPKWDDRCDRISFVGMFRCDRASTASGRCVMHDEPQHQGAPHWRKANELKRVQLAKRALKQKLHEERGGKIVVHQRTRELVARFSAALLRKLAAAQKKYGYSDGWADPNWMDECRHELLRHIDKGDPLDVAAYAAFLWHHGEPTTKPQEIRKEDLLRDLAIPVAQS